jgi:hypothetical protein
MSMGEKVNHGGINTDNTSDILWAVASFPGISQALIAIFAVILAYIIRVNYKSGDYEENKPKAKQSSTQTAKQPPQNIPTLTNTVPKRTAPSQSANKALPYAVYLYALQQMYGQDTAKTRQALQNYLQAGGDKSALNSMFNDTVQKLRSNSATADKLAQDFLQPKTIAQILANLNNSIGSQHQEF